MRTGDCLRQDVGCVRRMALWPELQTMSTQARNLVTTDRLGDSITVGDASLWSIPRSLVFARRPCLPVSWAKRPACSGHYARPPR